MSGPEQAVRRRRGVATLMMLSIVPILGFGALVFDVGNLQVIGSQHQAAVDAATLAGVGRLDGTSQGVQAAIATTRAFAGRNRAFGEPVVLRRQDIHAGRFDPATGRFTSEDDPLQVNALYVEHRVEDLPTIFSGAAFGFRQLAVASTSVSRSGDTHAASETPCFLPLAVPECMLDDPDRYESRSLRMSSAQLDNTGWGNPFGVADDSAVVEQIGDQCDQGSVYVGDRVHLNNGQVNTAFHAIASALEASETPWDTARYGPQPAPMAGEDGSVSTLDRYGYVIEGPIMLFDGTTTDCGAAEQFNQSRPVTGFAWATIYDVDAQGSGKNLRVRLDLTHEHDVGSGTGGAPGATVVWQDDHQLVY